MHNDIWNAAIEAALMKYKDGYGAIAALKRSVSGGLEVVKND